MSDQPAMQDYVRRRMAGAEPAPVPAQNPVLAYLQQQQQFAGGEAGQVQSVDPAPGIAPQDRSFDAPVYVENPGLPTDRAAPPASNWQQRLGELQQQLTATHNAYQGASVLQLLFHPELRQQWQAALDAVNAHLDLAPSNRLDAAAGEVPGDVNAIQQGITQRQQQGRGEQYPAPSGTFTP